MSRRSTPERIDEARRAATRNRLIGEGATDATADAWIAAWEARATKDGLKRGASYWEAGWAWIAGATGAEDAALAATFQDVTVQGAQRPPVALGEQRRASPDA